MADPVAPKSQPPLGKKRAVQRCPNCDIRCDVSLFVDGSLARCGHCGVRFEVHREKSAPPAQPPPQPQAKAPEPSLPRLDGFTVHERIGQGGMGEVFRCTRASDQVPVAVKILTPQMAAVPDYVRRLGRGKAGQHVYIAMELIDGESLRMWAHANRPAPRQLAALLAQVAHALAYAHARAVVHRDLKPDNVLVTKDLRTKMLDFGLAGLHAEGAQCLTQSNVAMGTANYMAPEQRKDAKRADHRADLYSFGVMTYELLTGELPLGKFAAPSKAVAGLDPRWDAVVERCLEPDPAARPHSALEVAGALEALAGIARPMQLAPRTRKNTRRAGVWSWLGLGTAVAVMVGVAGLRVSQDHKSKPSLATVRAMAKKTSLREH